MQRIFLCTNCRNLSVQEIQDESEDRKICENVRYNGLNYPGECFGIMKPFLINSKMIVTDTDSQTDG